MSEDTAEPLPVALPVARRPQRVRRKRIPIIGPLFAWDLVRLARKGQDARSRTILASVLLVTLVFFTILWFHHLGVSEIFLESPELATNDVSRFGEQFMLTMLVAQMCVMILLTPAYAAGSVAEEKERRTWPFLMTTDLSNREIVLGKYFGRNVFLLGVMFAGLPVMAICILIGGVDPTYLMFGYLLTGTTVALLAAAGLTAAIYATTFRGAMFRAYGLTALYVLFGGGVYPLLSPVAVLWGLYQLRENSATFYTLGGAYIFAQVFLTVIFLWMGIARLRKVERRAPQRPRRMPRDLEDHYRPPKKEEPQDDRWGETERRTRKRHRAPQWAEKPRIGNGDPFYWKEKYTQGQRRTADDESIQSLMTVVGVLVAVFLALAVLIAVLVGVGTGKEGMSKTLIWAGMAGVAIHLLTLGPSACGTIIRERARLTLDSLLTIPVPRTAILEPKWLINFSRGWWWGGPGMVCVVLGLMASDVAALAFPVLVYLPAAAACCVSFGLWLSVRQPTIVRAVMIYLSMAGALCVVPLFVWWQADERYPVHAVTAMSVLTVLVGGLGYYFWRRCVKEFESYGRN